MARLKKSPCVNCHMTSTSHHHIAFNIMTWNRAKSLASCIPSDRHFERKLDINIGFQDKNIEPELGFETRTSRSLVTRPTELDILVQFPVQV